MIGYREVITVPKIDPSVLRQLRTSKGWSQDQLAENTKLGRNPKIDKRTISRLEQGKQTNTRGRTIQQLARVFGVELAVLTGEAPIPDAKRQDQPASESSIQISAHARNALHLIHERYRVREWQIVEMAPFLFCWAAEASLRQRLNRIEQLERTCRTARDQERQVEYLRMSDFSDLEEKIEAEKDSIRDKDLFGYQIDEAGFANFKHEWTENPFARFLSDLVEGFDDVVTFDGFSSIDYPEYSVCPEEAEQLVGGDKVLAGRILSGIIALNEMPAEIRESFNSADRADWVRAKAAEFISRIDGQFPSKVKEM
jgi:transcriptional regulator with XRE-family HTH domain